MTTRDVWKEIDFGYKIVDGSGKVVLTVEYIIGDNYSIYWPSQCDVRTFVGHLRDLHRRGQLVNGRESKGYVDVGHCRVEEFPSVDEALGYAERHEREFVDKRFLRLSFDGSDYFWDNSDVIRPFASRTIGVINSEDVPVDNVVELLRLISPEVDEELLTLLQNEPPPTAPSSRQ